MNYTKPTWSEMVSAGHLVVLIFRKYEGTLVPVFSFFLFCKNEFVDTSQKCPASKGPEAGTNLNNLSGLAWLLSYS